MRGAGSPVLMGCRCSHLLQTPSNKADASMNQPRLPGYPIGLKTLLVLPQLLFPHFGELDYALCSLQMSDKADLPQFPMFSIA